MNDTVTGAAAASRHACHRHALSQDSQDFRILTFVTPSPGLCSYLMADNHLYVILDIFSRYAVGWMVATRESAVLAEQLIAATCTKQGITRGQLSIHADRGSSMTSINPHISLAGNFS